MNNNFMQKTRMFLLTIMTFALIFVMTASLAFADCSNTSPPTCTYISSKTGAKVTPSFQGASPTCQNIQNNCSSAVMIPTANQNEWSSFVSSQIANGGCISLSGCTTGCAAANPSWLTNCSGPLNANSIGAQVQVTNTVSGYNGTETATCQASGQWAYSNASCGSGVCGNLDVQFGSCGDIEPGCNIFCSTYHCDSGPYALGPTCQGKEEFYTENGHDACIHTGTDTIYATCTSNGTWQY